MAQIAKALKKDLEQPTVASQIKIDVNCDHEWELKDDSFDHEFGCEQIQYYECVKCEETKDLD